MRAYYYDYISPLLLVNNDLMQHSDCTYATHATPFTTQRTIPEMTATTRLFGKKSRAGSLESLRDDTTISSLSFFFRVCCVGMRMQLEHFPYVSLGDDSNGSKRATSFHAALPFQETDRRRRRRCFSRGRKKKILVVRMSHTGDCSRFRANGERKKERKKEKGEIVRRFGQGLSRSLSRLSKSFSDRCHERPERP